MECYKITFRKWHGSNLTAKWWSDSIPVGKSTNISNFLLSYGLPNVTVLKEMLRFSRKSRLEVMRLQSQLLNRRASQDFLDAPCFLLQFCVHNEQNMKLRMECYKISFLKMAWIKFDCKMVVGFDASW